MKAPSFLFAGLLFGAGLAMSGMTDITKVIGFLDLAGDFDPTLAFVMGGGVAVTLPFFQLLLPRIAKPVFDPDFRLPTRRDIDLPLVSGSLLFGAGWGTVGLCPGPAIASLSYLNPDILAFVIAMFLGLAIGDVIQDKSAGAKAGNTA